MNKLILLLMVFAMTPAAWSTTDSSLPETTTVVAEFDGELQTVEVETDAFMKTLSHTFYYCASVPGGYQRCSKRNGRCFGAVFRLLRQCQAALHPDDD